MPADAPCPNPDCPMMLRRTEDTGIQAVLQAINNLETTVRGMNQTVQSIATAVAVHETKITTMEQTSKGSVDRRWMIAAASIGLLPTLFGWFVKWVKGS